MATLAPVISIPRKPRPESDYETPARLFIASGIPSAALRRRALIVPEDADVLRGLADAMDAMAVT